MNICDLYLSGMSSREIAKKNGMTIGKVVTKLYTEDIEIRYDDIPYLSTPERIALGTFKNKDTITPT